MPFLSDECGPDKFLTILSPVPDNSGRSRWHDGRMKFLRALHLYSGCFFAPLLVFFAVSGIWQLFRWQWGNGPMASWLAHLSTIHTGHGFKGGTLSFSSPMMTVLIVVMAFSLILTIALGIVMAFRYGRRRTVLWCLFVGTAIPLALVLLACPT